MDIKFKEFLILKLDFIRKILDFSPELTSEQDKEVLELIKHYSQYDFAAEIVRRSIWME